MIVYFRIPKLNELNSHIKLRKVHLSYEFMNFSDEQTLLIHFYEDALYLNTQKVLLVRTNYSIQFI
jgi:hypothetical protein